ncbi:Alpha/Beta hydrolase protein [Nemania serpens]|nr:Alpha/Beta hydrolase protein [Nemania serpens]
MTSTPILEGEVAFGAPGAGKPTTTYSDFYHLYGIPIVYYDQIGCCGRSTHFEDRLGDESFWTFDLFIRELDNLIDHLKLRSNGFFLLGHSWGGMLGGAENLQKIILSGAPGSVPLLAQGSRNLLAALPEVKRVTLEECDRKGDHESPEFEQASKVFYDRHVCRLNPYPEDVLSAFKNLKRPYFILDDVSPSEFIIVGTLKNWEGWKEGHNIEVQAMLVNGQYDEATDLCMQPWFSSIPKVRWVTI